MELNIKKTASKTVVTIGENKLRKEVFCEKNSLSGKTVIVFLIIIKVQR
ncbi:MAG: hypothetical protein MJZ56_03595 [Bacteroidales bacterium]|nr:hypothetical protein [Bacteroidales bacterium]